MNYKTAEEVARAFGSLPPHTKLCPFCYHVLQLSNESEEYCPNEMCLNDDLLAILGGKVEWTEVRQDED